MVATLDMRSIVKQRIMPHDYAHAASGGRFKIFPHIAYIGRKMFKAATTPGSRIIINVPPRHAKSYLISWWLPVWYLDNFPERKIMLASYGQKLADSWGRKVRNEIDTNPFVLNKLSKDSTAANRFDTAAGGSMYCSGIDGSTTGFGADFLDIDDPHKSMTEAYSRRVRHQSYEWWHEVYSRLEPGASVAIVMQRLHPDDLCGYIMANSKDDWEVIRLPAIAEDHDPIGRNPGEALCPERYDVEALRQIEREALGEGWSARYQQQPKLLRSSSVYHNFDDGPGGNVRDDLVLDPHLPLHLSIDFNVNPGSHMVIGQHHPATDTFTSVFEIHQPRMAIEAGMVEFEKLVAQLGGFVWPELQVFGDPSGKSSSLTTGATCYDYVTRKLRNMGMTQLSGTSSGKTFRLRVPSAAPRVIDRVNVANYLLKDFDGKRRWLMHPRCVRLITDMKELKTGADGQPDKDDQELSHSSDADTYRLIYMRPRLDPVAVPVATYQTY